MQSYTEPTRAAVNVHVNVNVKPASPLLTPDNYSSNFLRFGDRQAGVSIVYSPAEQRYSYNAYCLEITLLKELFSIEYDFLDDALATINAEFSTWELTSFDKKAKKGCGNCAAKG